MIEPLKVNRKLLIWICLHPADSSTSLLWRCVYGLFAFLVFMLNLAAAIATLFFLLENRSANMKDDIYAFAITICYFAANVAMLLEYSFRNSIIAAFDQLAEIYDKSMYAMNSILIWLQTKIYSYISIQLTMITSVVDI